MLFLMTWTWHCITSGCNEKPKGWQGLAALHKVVVDPLWFSNGAIFLTPLVLSCSNLTLGVCRWNGLRAAVLSFADAWAVIREKNMNKCLTKATGWSTKVADKALSTQPGLTVFELLLQVLHTFICNSLQIPLQTLQTILRSRRKYSSNSPLPSSLRIGSWAMEIPARQWWNPC